MTDAVEDEVTWTLPSTRHFSRPERVFSTETNAPVLESRPIFLVFSMGEYLGHPRSFHNRPNANPDPLPRTDRGAVLAAEPDQEEPGERGG